MVRFFENKAGQANRADFCSASHLWTAKWWTQGDTPGGVGMLVVHIQLKHGLSDEIKK